MKKYTYLILILLPLILFCGCATTMQARKVKPSGFLGDYSGFVKGEKDRAVLIFHGTQSLKGYSSIQLDPVQIYLTEKSKLRKMKKDDLQALLDYFDAALRRQLIDAYPLTDIPGPGTLRMRVALTEAKASVPVLDLLSNVSPYGLAVSAVLQIATGTPDAVGRVQVEIELLDSLSGERLGAAVDARVGTKVFRGKFDKWDDVKSAFDFWAQRITLRMQQARQAAEQLQQQKVHE